MSCFIHTIVMGQWIANDDFQGDSNPRNLLYSMLRYIYSHFVDGKAGESIINRSLVVKN